MRVPAEVVSGLTFSHRVGRDSIERKKTMKKHFGFDFTFTTFENFWPFCAVRSYQLLGALHLKVYTPSGV